MPFLKRSGALSAPMSRADDAPVTGSSCMSCSADVSGWGWRNQGGTGVLMHDTDTDPRPCPAAEPFDWATGQTRSTGSVAA
jgi:hypothetical protein